MIISPQSDFRLLQCPLELSQAQQLDFANKNAQYAYFNGLVHEEFDDFTYIRKDNVVRVEGNVEDFWKYNYCMYRNDAFSDKWFYAYVERLEYVGHNCTAVYIKTDVWQTWQFDLKMKQCFVEREHVADDSIGLHTVPENVELGEMVQCANSVIVGQTTSIKIIFQVSEVISQMNAPAGFNNGGIYNGIFSGLTMFAVGSYEDARKVIQAYQEGKESAIVAIFYAPPSAVPTTSSSTTTTGATVQWITPTTQSTILDSGTVNRPTYLGGATMTHYVPKNNKLFTFPYCYLRATNNTGQNTEYRFEDFESGNASVTATIALCQGCSVYMKPTHYLGSASGSGVRDYGLAGGKYPILGWATDYYTNWETQNAVNLPLQTANAGINAIGSFLSGNLGGVLTGLGDMIGGAVSQVYEAKLHPDQARGNSNCGDINYSDGFTCFELIPMSIKAEYAKIIDGYFSMFGYKVNTVKIPQWNSRPTWNYVKTMGATFEADCPGDDASELKTMFDNGLTVWHVPAQFGNYSFNNK